MKKNEILLRVVDNLLDENKQLRAEISQFRQREMNPGTSEFFESLVNPKIKVKVEPRFEKGGVIHDSENEPIINKGEDIVNTDLQCAILSGCNKIEDLIQVLSNPIKVEVVTKDKPLVDTDTIEPKSETPQKAKRAKNKYITFILEDKHLFPVEEYRHSAPKVGQTVTIRGHKCKWKVIDVYEKNTPIGMTTCVNVSRITKEPKP